ncbi:MAG: hypothetical protein IRZ16_10510 [Myxococcaceae bacterium]|nr:hypothetical protein [Myxococcaceae bacterium]
METSALTNKVKVVARSSDRGQKIWRWGDRLVIRGNAAGNRDRPARLTLELDAQEKVVVTLEKGMDASSTLGAITCCLPPTIRVDAEMVEENAIAFRLLRQEPQLQLRSA